MSIIHISTGEQWAKHLSNWRNNKSMPIGHIEGKVLRVFHFPCQPQDVFLLQVGQYELEVHLQLQNISVVLDRNSEAAVADGDHILVRYANLKGVRERIWSTTTRNYPTTEILIRRGSKLIEIKGHGKPVITDVDIDKVEAGEAAVPGIKALQKELTEGVQESDFTWGSQVTARRGTNFNTTSRMLLELIENPGEAKNGIAVACTDYSRFAKNEGIKVSMFAFGRARDPFLAHEFSSGDIIDAMVRPQLNATGQAIGTFMSAPVLASPEMIDIFNAHKEKCEAQNAADATGEDAVPERPAAEAAVPERSAAEAAVPERSAAEAAVPERSATEAAAVPESGASNAKDAKSDAANVKSDATKDVQEANAKTDSITAKVEDTSDSEDYVLHIQVSEKDVRDRREELEHLAAAIEKRPSSQDGEQPAKRPRNETLSQGSIMQKLNPFAN